MTLRTNNHKLHLALCPLRLRFRTLLYSSLLATHHANNNTHPMARRPEFDLLYPSRSGDSTNNPGASRHSSKPEARGESEEEEEEDDLLLLEAYVHRSRTEELEKRLNLQQSTHFTAAADLQARITCLESQLDKQATELSKKSIDLARERDRCKELVHENAQLRTSDSDGRAELRALVDTNDALHIEINMKENAISNLEAELATLREDFANREQTLIAKVSSLDQSLSDLRIQLEESQSETNSQSILLSQIKEEMRVAREGETMAKERLIKTEKKCAEKTTSVIQREADAVAAATSDLNAKLQLAEERAQIAEEREESANAIRRKAEIEAADLRTAAEKHLFQSKQQIRREYELLLQSKNDDLVATNKLRETEASQMEDLRETLAIQANNHKSELERHTEKIKQLSSDLHQAHKDLDSERKASSKLRIDLGKAQTRLDGATRKHQEDGRAWEQEKSLLEDEMSIVKAELDMQEESNGEEIAKYAEKIRRGVSERVDLERRLVDSEKQYHADRELLLKKAEDALRNVFTTG